MKKQFGMNPPIIQKNERNKCHCQNCHCNTKDDMNKTSNPR